MLEQSTEQPDEQEIAGQTPNEQEGELPRYERVRVEGGSYINVLVPMNLRERAKKVAKKLKTPMSQLARDALTEKIEYFESKFQADKARAAAEKEQLRGFRRMKPLSNPIARNAIAEQKQIPPEYDLHATRIHEAVQAGSPNETRLRVAEAVAAIKRQSPLTHPPETEIVATLERLVVAKRDALATTATPAKEPDGILIDTTKIRSHGDVGEGE